MTNHTRMATTYLQQSYESGKNDGCGTSEYSTSVGGKVFNNSHKATKAMIKMRRIFAVCLIP
jgi:hypothetical protein